MWAWKKGNEYGTLTQRSPERLLVEFWGFLSPNHWKAQRPFDRVFFFSPVPHLVCVWLPKWRPIGFKNAKPILSRLVNFCDLWQWGETFCRGFGALPGWLCQLLPLLSRTEEWWEGGAEWMRLDSQVEEGKYLAMPLGEGIQASSPTKAMPLSHRIRPCLYPAPRAASHSVFRVTDLISWIIFQAGHRWGIKLKTRLGMGHKG